MSKKRTKTEKSNKVDGRPSMQFYPDDWLGDTNLRLCSLASRGLWVDIICHAWRSEKRGFLLINGQALDKHDISALVGRPIAEVEQALDELMKWKVCSITADGTIYCRRMVREEAVRQKKIAAGRKGGKAKGKSKNEAPDQAKDQAKGGSSTPTSSSSSTSTPASHEVESKGRAKKPRASHSSKSRREKIADIIGETK